ncbi:hypothetical protein PV08_10649 [Exophiala spinifera]|uniref:Uncharacterized protein n=1 Tax=Exophiala spinifera TaxID=91928 RepID=A0A0D2BJ22_9EURO|nr:uncharacterized protein PV08_10649 [Exophiala spinifera]KIW11349.1 hypothetical protein PV08_10649 [Exophiala spinifera]
MTDEEVEMMRQGQMEAAVNRVRLKERSRDGRDSGRFYQYLTVETNETTPSLTLPIQLGASDTLRKDLDRTGTDNHHHPIDPTLANNKKCVDHHPSSVTTTTSDTRSNQSGPVLERLQQRHYDHGAKSSQYWSGRYLSVCDRIRSEPLKNNKLLPPVESSTQAMDMVFDACEKARIRLALDELRRSCMTHDALESFEHFETGLLKKIGTSHHSLYRESNSLSRVSDTGSILRTTGGGGRKSGDALNVPNLLWTPSTPNRWLSSINAEAAMSISSGSFEGKGALAKSKTTGNLASFIPKFSSRQLPPYIKTNHQSNSTAPNAHQRRVSYIGLSPESAGSTAGDREPPSASQNRSTHRRSGSQMSSPGLVNSESRSPESQSTLTTTTMVEKDRSLIFGKKVRKLDQVVRSLDCAMMESGHTIPPCERKSQPFFPRVQMVTVQGEKEKVIRSWRKSERQSSGEMLRNLFGAGVREVKKMGRRVGAMSIGSSEDLPSSRHE